MSLISKRCLALVTIVALGLITAACAPSAKPPASEKAAPGEKVAQTDKAPKRGGTITFNYASAWNADPAMGQTPYTTWYYAGDPMIYRDPETFELKPSVFESWKVSPDGKEITLKVRQGMKFHNKPPINGREVEAKDLVYVLKSATGLQYPDLPSVRFPRKQSFKGMVDAVAVDKYTVKVTLENPSVSFLHALGDYRGTWVYPDGLREAFGGTDSLAQTDPKKDIGSGPFILTKFTSAVEQIFERNPSYWQPGKPYLDRVRVLQIPDTSTQQAAFVTGQMDTQSLSGAQARDFILGARKDIQVIDYAPNSCWNRISLNTQRKPLDDYRVRRALYLVVDKKALGETLRGSTADGKPLWKYPGPLPWVFTEAIPQEELAKHPLYLGPTPENVAEAKRLLKEAGYEGGFALEMLGASSTVKEEGTLIHADITKYLPEVKLTLKPVDTEIHRARAAKGDYDAQLYCHIHDVTAVAHLAQAHHTLGGRNYGQYKDPELDAILDEADRTLDPAKYKVLVVKAQNYILDKSLSMLPTLHSQAQIALQPDLRGMRFGAGNSNQVGAWDWWRDK